MKRRHFIQKSAGAGFWLAATPWPSFLDIKDDFITLTILHTNDTHSRIDPFPIDGSRVSGTAGVARRATMIRNIRQEAENVLLLDSGDIFQGTPYFNYFLGELEFKLMDEMGYDVATIGNHDFDAGMENLAEKISMARFSMVNSNYGFDDTVMHDKVEPHRIFQYGDLKVGVFGVGIELEGLVAPDLCRGTRYFDPVSRANEAAVRLKKEHDCHYVICLSHLGYRYRGDKVSDIILAEQSKNIDLILGGHTHTFMDGPETYRNLEGEAVMIHQVGFAGILLGRIDIQFERNFKRKCVTCRADIVQ